MGSWLRELKRVVIELAEMQTSKTTANEVSRLPLRTWRPLKSPDQSFKTNLSTKLEEFKAPHLKKLESKIGATPTPPRGQYTETLRPVPDFKRI
jgi:hypothetical protein